MGKDAGFAAKRGPLVYANRGMSQRSFFLISLVSRRTVNLSAALRANLVVSGHLSWNRII